MRIFLFLLAITIALLQSRGILAMMAPPKIKNPQHETYHYDTKKVGEKLREELLESKNQLKELDVYLEDQGNREKDNEKLTQNEEAKKDDNKIFHYESKN